MAKVTKQQIIDELQGELTRANRQMERMKARGEMLKIQARYEAAQTYPGNMGHWQNSDLLSPDAANRFSVRQRLMSRSRFEIVENNPYLNGIVQTICNDFAGTGIRLRLTDKDIPAEFRQRVEKRFSQWQKASAFRQVLWSMRVTDPHAGSADLNQLVNDVDGIRLDRYGFPDAYYVYNYHPGGGFLPVADGQQEGKWIPADQICHWFMKMRRWHRGIPELTPSIPLCAVARRYTFALVKCMELQACLAAVLESDTPATCMGSETPDDNPNFQTVPIVPGMFNMLPWGARLRTFDRVPAGQQYDDFIGALLREIVRPLLIPYNMQIGSSKDSNMASGVLDAGIYTNGQKTQRCSCEEDVVRKVVSAWYRMGCLTPGYFQQAPVPASMRNVPDYDVIWDKVTVEHTDPTKIMSAMKIAKESGLMSDRDIQEFGFNKDLDEYHEDRLEDKRFELKMAKIQKQINDLTNPQPVTTPTEPNDENTEENEDE